MRTRAVVSRLFPAMLIALLALIATGCGTVRHNLVFQNNYAPQSGTRIEVGRVTNKAGKTFDIDIEEMLADALVEAFRTNRILWLGKGHKLVVTCDILKYEKGNAFKRWLSPGWGTTVLKIKGTLTENGQAVGAMEALRTVTFGGVFTIGAWKRVFTNVAKDIARDLRSKIPK